MKAAASEAADVSAVKDDRYRNRTPLYLAVQARDLEGVRRLLDEEEGADLAQQESEVKWAWDPLHVAAENGDLDLARLLLERGAKLERRTESGLWSPLHLAAMPIARTW